jgi:hypothetical protein
LSIKDFSRDKLFVHIVVPRALVSLAGENKRKNHGASMFTDEQVARFLAQLGITAEEFLEASKNIKAEAGATDANFARAVEEHLRKLRGPANEAQ